MTRRDRWRVFDDSGERLDRFGPLLVFTAIAVSTLSLFDLGTTPSEGRWDLGWLLVSLTLGGALLLALASSGVSRRWQRISTIVVGATLVAAVFFAFATKFFGVPNLINPGSPNPLWVAITVVSPLVVLRRVLSHKTVTIETLFGALSVFLLMAIAFHYIFFEVERFTSVPFFGNLESTSSYMYYSLSTITTVGYGDLSSASDFGRFVSSAEAVVGQVFLVTIVARLVGLMAVSPRRSDG